MSKIDERDYNLINALLSCKEDTLYAMLYKVLLKYYSKKNIKVSKNYLYAIGDIPIGLVAHLDTVYNSPVDELYFDPRFNVFWSPDGLGADDRAGVFAILKILQKGLKPTIIFTKGEEVGGKGAYSLIKDFHKPFSKLCFLIELDRQGFDEAVYYGCNNAEFENFISNFGFVKDVGTFSDISIIAPFWGIAAVNLSIGYIDEHSYSERWFINETFKIIKQVIKILSIEKDKIPYFKYETFLGVPHTTCWICEKKLSKEDITNVTDFDGSIYHLCQDCANAFTIKCEHCGEYFISRKYHICGEQGNVETV